MKHRTIILIFIIVYLLNTLKSIIKVSVLSIAYFSLLCYSLIISINTLNKWTPVFTNQMDNMRKSNQLFRYILPDIKSVYKSTNIVLPLFTIILSFIIIWVMNIL